MPAVVKDAHLDSTAASSFQAAPKASSPLPSADNSEIPTVGGRGPCRLSGPDGFSVPQALTCHPVNQPESCLSEASVLLWLRLRLRTGSCHLGRGQAGPGALQQAEGRAVQLAREAPFPGHLPQGWPGCPDASSGVP